MNVKILFFLPSMIEQPPQKREGEIKRSETGQVL